MAKNKKQAVEPNVSPTKFENEIAEFLLIENDWRKKGVICVKAEFPVFEFIFIAHHVKPATVAFAVSIDFTNYDVEPPSLLFVDPFTGNPLITKDMNNLGFFQIVNQEIQIAGIQIPGMQGGMQQIQQKNPILMIGDKKHGAFRTPKINSVIAEIARLSGDLLLKEKGLNPFLLGQSLFAERTLQSSNLMPLNKLQANELTNIVSPHRITVNTKGSLSDALFQDLIAINDFLFALEADPFVSLEKIENRKRMPFKKLIGELA